jgi:hypothetical protein
MILKIFKLMAQEKLPIGLSAKGKTIRYEEDIVLKESGLCFQTYPNRKGWFVSTAPMFSDSVIYTGDIKVGDQLVAFSDIVQGNIKIYTLDKENFI